LADGLSAMKGEAFWTISVKERRVRGAKAETDDAKIFIGKSYAIV